jgi:hypothetical protein
LKWSTRSSINTFLSLIILLQLRVQSYEKTREEQKKLVSFFLRVAVNSRCKRKVTKKACKKESDFGRLTLIVSKKRLPKQEFSLK